MSRFNTFFGRIGAVFLTICAALAILTLIPPTTMYSSSGTRVLEPGKFIFETAPYQINPQIFLKIEINTNTTIEFCIISSPRTGLSFRVGNLTELKQFLDENGCEVVKNVTVNAGTATLEFTPGGLLNASFLTVNRSPYTAQISYDVELLMSIAPKVRIIPVITYMSPVGAILVGQWIFIEFKSRRKEF